MPSDCRIYILRLLALSGLVILWAGMVWLAAGCSAAPGYAAPTPTPAGGYAVDPIFREFYFYLGGEAVLGRAIQPPQINGPGRTQLLEKGKLVYDPTASIQKYFTLAPLGVQLGLGEDPQPAPGQYAIAPEFLAAYERLGPLNVGRPLGEAHYDSYYGRQEQYFENLGFYRQEGSSEVRLLSYGVSICQCSETLPPGLPETGAIDAYYPVDPTFEPFVRQLGAEFTGPPISEAYLNQEGRWEQIFRNQVLIASAPGASASVQLRQLTREIRLPVDPPRRPSHRPDDHFYNAGSGLGYDIPAYFWDYLADHGGL